MTDPDAPDVELLADLDAGLLDPARADDVRRAALDDPLSAAVLDALAATRADLAALPALSAPPDRARRWVAALDDAQAPGQPRRIGPWVRRRALLAAAAAVVVALVTGLLVSGPGGPPDVGRVELAAVARSTVGLTDLGELADPFRRAACLAAAGHPGAEVLGGRRVRLEGSPGVLLVLSTGELGRFRVLVVTPSCSVLADSVVGGP